MALSFLGAQGCARVREGDFSQLRIAAFTNLTQLVAKVTILICQRAAINVGAVLALAFDSKSLYGISLPFSGALLLLLIVFTALMAFWQEKSYFPSSMVDGLARRIVLDLGVNEEDPG